VLDRGTSLVGKRLEGLEMISAMEELIPAFCIVVFFGILVYVGLTVKDDE
jgi:hypothetical protein